MTQNLASQSANKDLLDIATKIAISAAQPVEKGREKEPAVDSTTINNLLSFMQANKSIRKLLAYILRQTGRNEIDNNTCKLLLNALKDFKESDEDIYKALELLGNVKWIYETITGLKVDAIRLKDVKNFQELVDRLTKMI